MLSDAEIQGLIDEGKQLPHDFRKRIKLKQRQGTQFKVSDDIYIPSSSGKKFLIKIRTNIINNHDFSIILIHIDDMGTSYILRRYNGSHQHRNKIEKTVLNGFHIHKATERYQKFNEKIDGYAETTVAYSAWVDALRLMLVECNFKTTNSTITLPALPA